MEKTKLQYEKALQLAADVVNRNDVYGKRDHANPNTMSSFFVSYVRGSEKVTLGVEMNYMATTKSFVLVVKTSFGSTYRTMQETRDLLNLLSDVTAVGEKVDQTLAAYEFTAE
jgi:hypothetical protein